MEPTGQSYWCHTCNRFVGVQCLDTILCLDCGGGFLEEIDADLYVDYARANQYHVSVPVVRPNWRSASSSRSLFNPVIAFRRQSHGRGEDGEESRPHFELYYYDTVVSGLRMLPARMSGFFRESRLDRLLDRMTPFDVNDAGGLDYLPASKAAVESLPTVKIDAKQVAGDAHCAVCKEQFQFGVEAREMPCKHIYHSDCILPWLSLKNSCPVCRHELPTEAYGDDAESFGSEGSNGEDPVGLTIWRLPGGGYAVATLRGEMGAAESELPGVYTEMDGGSNAFGAPRGITWSTSENRTRGRSGMNQTFRNLLSLFGRSRSSSSQFRLDNGFRRSRSQSVFSNRFFRRNTPRWDLDDNEVTRH
ncbi:hypothetical protein RJ639_032197 [Escallonia herrerae]|uniref:RING-type E3 ubiquitin transferase n=1 Tax=Escallonia herrerae TaxID=1293975 RepID=A0AA89BF20_9ASTE|nr:hypothetical protein RJ639_032197 [Escallonia herrerae]